MAEVSRCRSCGAAIIWARTVGKQKRIPLDRHPVPADTKGALLLVAGNWAYGPADLTERLDSQGLASIADAERLLGETFTAHLAHFATCPNAEDHRKPRTVTAPAPGEYHHDGPDTERAAAESVTETTGRMRGLVLDALRDAGPIGLTDDEGAARLGLRDRLTFGKRRHELVQAGLVEDSTERRQTPLGRKAVVWVATP